MNIETIESHYRGRVPPKMYNFAFLSLRKRCGFEIGIQSGSALCNAITTAF